MDLAEKQNQPDGKSRNGTICVYKIRQRSPNQEYDAPQKKQVPLIPAHSRLVVFFPLSFRQGIKTANQHRALLLKKSKNNSEDQKDNS